MISIHYVGFKEPADRASINGESLWVETCLDIENINYVSSWGEHDWNTGKTIVHYYHDNKPVTWCDDCDCFRYSPHECTKREAA